MLMLLLPDVTLSAGLVMPSIRGESQGECTVICPAHAVRLFMRPAGRSQPASPQATEADLLPGCRHAAAPEMLLLSHLVVLRYHFILEHLDSSQGVLVLRGSQSSCCAGLLRSLCYCVQDRGRHAGLHVQSQTHGNVPLPRGIHPHQSRFGRYVARIPTNTLSGSQFYMQVIQSSFALWKWHSHCVVGGAATGCTGMLMTSSVQSVGTEMGISQQVRHSHSKAGSGEWRLGWQTAPAAHVPEMAILSCPLQGGTAQPRPQHTPAPLAGVTCLESLG